MVCELECKRLIQLASGRCAGYFESVEGRVGLVLEPDGSCLSYSFGDGEIYQELTRYAKTKIQHAVKDVIAFRNRISEKPFVVEELHEEDVVLDYRLRSIRWPMSPQVVEELDDGTLCLHSIEGAAVLSWARGCCTFNVQILCPLSPRRSDMRYKSISQTFFCDEPPACYVHALDLVRQSLKLDDASDQSVECLGPYRSECAPRACVSEPSWGDEKIIQDVLLRLCSEGEKGVCDIDPIRFEWTPSATFRVTKDHSVHISIAADKSLLLLEKNGFYRHRMAGRDERIYAPEGVPRVIQIGDSAWYELGFIALHAQRLQHVCSRGDIMQEDSASASRCLSSGPLHVVEEEYVTGLGRFTFFSDQTVRVVFSDRTLLSSSAGFEECEVLCGDSGDLVKVNVTNPCHVARYVHFAQEFFLWAKSDVLKRPVHFENPNASRLERLLQVVSATRRQRLCNDLSISRISHVIDVK